MEQGQKEYHPMVVAVLEGLRASVYPSYHLRNSSQLSTIDDSEAVWALGILRETEDQGEAFKPSIFVKLVTDEEGHPEQFKCWDRHGREVETASGDVSKASLVEALKRLHHKKPGRPRHIWRWLGRKWRSRRGKNS